MAKANYDWVTNRVAVGGEITSLYDVRRMQADGITNILNVRTSQDEVEWVQKVGLKYSSNPTSDYGKGSNNDKPSSWFSMSSDIIRSAMMDPSAKILIHCQEGANRAPSTCYFYLRTLGLKKDLCYDLIVKARPVAKDMAYLKDAEAALKDLGYKD